MRRAVAICLVLAALSGCERESAPATSAGPAASAPVASPTAFDVVPIWRGLLSTDPAEMAGAIDRVAAAEPGALRAVRYNPVQIQGRPGLQVDGHSFEIGVPPLTREWFNALQSAINALSPEQQAGLLMRLDALMAGVMESWRGFDSPRPYEQAASLRVSFNEQLVKLGDAAASYNPAEKAATLKALARAAAIEGLKDHTVP